MKNKKNNKNSNLKNESKHHWHVIEVMSGERAYLYCIRIKSSESLSEDLSTARWMATEEHKRLYPDKPAFITDVLGFIESFMSED